MSERLTPSSVLQRRAPLVLHAYFRPVAGLDRFQPAGFPEIGHVLYRAPRADGQFENVCIVDSAASMANHLEALCMRGRHDFDLVDELQGMPYVRCVTGELINGKLPPQQRKVVVTSLTEGHRIASTYFLGGWVLEPDGSLSGPADTPKEKKGKGKTKTDGAGKFEARLVEEFGIVLAGSTKAHPPVEKWWDVFRTIFRYDPNALVHGVLFPQWQIKIPRVLTAHLEAYGAARVERSGVKFDRLGKTTSGQPIFAVDDATAREIRGTFILDSALVRSFGRSDRGEGLGLSEPQKEFLVALALWKVRQLCGTPFRFRSGCHLQCDRLTDEEGREVDIDVNIAEAIQRAAFKDPRVTDVYWPTEELYRLGESGGEQQQQESPSDGSNDEEGDGA